MKEQNIFREKLYNYEEPVPPGVWDRIVEKLPPDRKERAFPIFWLFLLASLITGGSIMFWANNQQPLPNRPAQNESEIAATSTPADETSDLINGNSGHTVSTTNQLESNSLASAEATLNDTESHVNENTTSGNQNQNNSASTISIGQTKVESISNQKSSSSTSPNLNKRHIGIEGKSGNKGPAVSNKVENRNQSTNKLSSNSNTITSNSFLEGPGQINASVNATEHLPNFVINTSKGTHSFIPNSTSGKLHVASLESEQHLIETESASVPVFPPPPADVDCYKFKHTGSPIAFSLEAFGGPGISPKSIQEKGSESSVYHLARSSTEHSQYAWSAGFRVNLHLRNGFAFKTGLLYEQTGDVFDYTDTLATKTSTQIDSFFSADGSFLYADTNRVLIFGTLIKKIHNTYKNIDLPFLLGYEFAGKRTVYMLHAGPVFHLSSVQEGQILNPMLHPQSITSDNHQKLEAYKSSLGVSLYVGGGVMFPLSKRISALVEPRILFRLKPVTLSGYVLTEKRHHVGLNLGIRYHL